MLELLKSCSDKEIEVVLKALKALNKEGALEGVIKEVKKYWKKYWKNIE